MSRHDDRLKYIEEMQKQYPEKFASEEDIFRHIRRGATIFIGTGCGQPQYLVRALVNYVRNHPKQIFDAEVIQVWSLGFAPYTDKKFKDNFRHNSFFVGDSTRSAINDGVADYTPIFLSRVPEIFNRKFVPVDVALIQVSPPDQHGYMNLGVSVDIVKSAVDNARLVIAQINPMMPRVHGDGFIHIKDIPYLIIHNEPILDYYYYNSNNEIVKKIGSYVANLILDGDTIQVGYGSLPNSVLAHLSGKKHLGVHTELLTDGIVDLMKHGVIDNSKKSVNRGRTVASFCMGSPLTYDFIHDNLSVEFRTIDYTNNILLLARQDNMTAINSALAIDLTGQATSESIGKTFYAGIGGQADFMRGAMLAKNGKSILTIKSTAADDTVSRIVPFLKEGAGVTLNRGDVHYVVTEYGIAYLHGKNIRERAMSLIAIAHPKFRSLLVEEGRKLKLIYRDQVYIDDVHSQYPEHLETYRTTRSGLDIFLRPVKISDEPLLKDFFYSLSDQSMYTRYMSMRKDMPHERLQELVQVDYRLDMMILAIFKKDEMTEELIGIGQYGTDQATYLAEVAFTVRDNYQGHGIGRELVAYLTLIAMRQGLIGFTAEVLLENRAMLALFEKMGYDMKKNINDGVYELEMMFKRS